MHDFLRWLTDVTNKFNSSFYVVTYNDKSQNYTIAPFCMFFENKTERFVFNEQLRLELVSEDIDLYNFEDITENINEEISFKLIDCNEFYKLLND